VKGIAAGDRSGEAGPHPFMHAWGQTLGIECPSICKVRSVLGHVDMGRFHGSYVYMSVSLAGRMPLCMPSLMWDQAVLKSAFLLLAMFLSLAAG